MRLGIVLIRSRNVLGSNTRIKQPTPTTARTNSALMRMPEYTYRIASFAMLLVLPPMAAVMFTAKPEGAEPGTPLRTALGIESDVLFDSGKTSLKPAGRLRAAEWQSVLTVRRAWADRQLPVAWPVE